MTGTMGTPRTPSPAPVGQDQLAESASLPNVTCTSNQSRFLKFRSSPSFIVFVVAISMFTDIFLYALLVPVIPEVLVSRAGVSQDDSQYWVTVFLVTEPAVAFIASPIFGYIADLKRLRFSYYLTGLVALAVGWAILATAHSIGAYMAGRVLQGMATAMLDVVGFAMVIDAVDTSVLGQMSGYLGASISLGFALGPIVGGPIFQRAGYYTVIGIGFAMIAIDLVLRLIMIESRAAEANIDESGCHTPDPPRKTKYVMLKIITQPRIIICLVATVVQGLIVCSFDATLPIFVESTFGWNSIGAGLIFLPTAIPALGEPLYGWMADTLGVRIMALTSFLLLSVPLVCLRFVTHNSLPQKVLISALLALIGLFTNSSAPACTLEIELVLESMDEKEPGIFGKNGAVAQGFSLQSSAYFLGVFLGPIWGGLVKKLAGWGTMAWTLGLLSGVTAILMLWISDGWGAYSKEKDSTIEICLV